MARAMRTSGTVTIEGMDTLLANLRAADQHEVVDAIRDAMEHAIEGRVLSDARSRAQGIADDGTYAGSLGVKRSGGKKLSRFLLVSTDPTAGVKEFANPGAVTVTSKGTPRANARLFMHSGVGVPRGNPPRAMVPAVQENAEELADEIQTAIGRVLDGVGR